MSKRPKVGANAGVQLFPFLAVLLCTMGALILLLMLLAQQARSQADAQAKARLVAARSQADDAELERRRDDLEWRIEQLAAARAKTQADVAAHRALLSHIEEHAQRLGKRLEELAAAEKLLVEQTVNGDIDKAALEAQLAELRAKIAAARLKLEEARSVGRKPQAFAVVPYDGANGTRRRPIYIECRGDAVVLQPEGIIFRESDFAGSHGPSNPLASCVRVVSEYITRGNGYADGEQPYPLLLVRPSGIGAYYAARSAMQSWDSEFGYELVNEDWPLEFPPADPLLGQMLAKTAEEARARQAMIARAAPSLRKARGGQQPSFNMAGGGGNGGGFEGTTPGNGGGGGYAGASPPGGASPFTPLDAGYSSTREVPGAAPGGTNAGLANSGLADGGFGVGNAAAAGGRYGDEGLRPGTTGTGGSANPGPALGAPGGASAQTGSEDSNTGDRYAANSPGGNNSGGARGGTLGGQSGGDSATGGSTQSGTFAGAEGGAGGTTAYGGASGSSPNFGGAPGTSAGGSSGGVSSAGSGASGGPGGSASAVASAEPAAPNISVQVPAGPGQYVEPIAKKRGKDWGLPEASARATPLTRPISLYMSADQVTIFSDRGLPDKQVPFAGTTEESVDVLVAQVREHVKSWGLAGRGMYWKPVLSVHVAPDGQARFNELKQLMAGSGLEVAGKQIAVASPAAPARR